MLRLVLRRLLVVVPTLLVITFLVFLLMQLDDTDPAFTAAGGTNATPEDIRETRAKLHLDDPLLSQYFRWVKGAVQLDFGHSYTQGGGEEGKSVAEELGRRIPVTMSLIVAATVFALLFAVPLGIFSGLRPNGAVDRGSRVFASLAIAIPSFVLALLLKALFAVELKWLPPNGYEQFGDAPLEWLRFITLPAIALAVGIAAAVMRQLRGALVDELDTNHIRTSWAIGGGTRRVVGRHGLKNASIPAITILGLQVAVLVGGAVLVEQIFAIPGIGQHLLAAIISGDIPTIQGCVIVLVIVASVMSLVVDLAYAFLNPKVRVAG
jgi:peptide/nickel transport system permease protein